MDHHKGISLPVLREHFPRMGKYRSVWPDQEKMMEFEARHGSCLIESPTGSGKTAVQRAIALAAEAEGRGPVFLTEPNKAILEQTAAEFPGDFRVAMGRNEHPCLYYHEDKEELAGFSLGDLLAHPDGLRADEIPCSMLWDCPHRVDQETGETFEPGSVPCPYYQQKFEAKQGGPILCTASFYLFAQLFTKEFGEAGTLIVDEVHRFAEIVRNALSYEISDWHLTKSVSILESIGADEAKPLERFRKLLVSTAKRKPARQPTLLSNEELRRFLAILEEIDGKVLEQKVRQAIRAKQINVVEDRVTLKKLEVLIRDLSRYIRSLEYSLTDADHSALNYTYAYYKEELSEKERVQYKLVIKGYYVAALIKKRLLAPLTVGFSATIGKPEGLLYEAGIDLPLLSLESGFPAENTRIFMPTDALDLSHNKQGKSGMAKTLRRIARAAKCFADQGFRSLVVTVSNIERDRFLALALEEGLDARSYGNGMTAKQAAILFRGGAGDCLVGTAANYAEGIDLPGGIAPVIFFLRPGYPQPHDPATIFEERRFGSQRWAIWTWRVMIQALQARGRNIRSESDQGVTFFASQQFRRIVFGSLPKWLQNSYEGEKTWEECLAETEKLLKKG